jgi:hypothetical protein
VVFRGQSFPQVSPGNAPNGTNSKADDATYTAVEDRRETRPGWKRLWNKPHVERNASAIRELLGPAMACVLTWAAVAGTTSTSSPPPAGPWSGRTTRPTEIEVGSLGIRARKSER